MAKAYLIVNSISYLVFALWCLFKPADTAQGLGYSFLNNGGKTEYMTVYGGMELGFCAFFALSAFYPKLMEAGLIFAVCLYLGLMLVRTITIINIGEVPKIIYIVGGLEYALGIWGAILLYIQLRK
jgi:hypothetical protein